MFSFHIDFSGEKTLKKLVFLDDVRKLILSPMVRILIKTKLKLKETNIMTHENNETTANKSIF